MPTHIDHSGVPYCGTTGPVTDDFDDVDCADCFALFHLSLADWERSLLGPSSN